MVSQAEQFVKTYKLLAQIPASLKGKIRSNGIVNTTWSQRNIEKGKTTIFQKDFFTNDLRKVAELAPIDVGSELLSTLSPSEKFRAVVRDCDGKKYLEVWKNSFLMRVVDLNAISDSNVHGTIYTDAEFSSFQWSPDENKILYLAEKKGPASEPFYKRKGKEDFEKKGNGDEEKPKGDEYKFEQHWGEQLVGKKVTVISQYDIENDKIEILKGIPEEICVAQVKFSPDGTYVIGVAYKLEPRLLGLIYCTNRESTIFRLDFNENYVALPLQEASVKNPIFSIDGNNILWLQRKKGGPHASCMSLMSTTVPLTEKSEVKTVVEMVESEISINNDKMFHGLYCQGFIQRPWASGNRLIISTNQKYTINSYIINIDSGSITELNSSDGNLMVYDVVDDVILACQRNFLKPDKLVIGKLPDHGEEQNIIWNDLTESNVVEGLENCTYKYLDLKAKGDSVESFNAIYIGPKNGNEKSVPLVVWPHGGPHSVFGNFLFLEGVMFLSFGYAILLVNYRGSLGSGQKSVEFLLGKIGVSDVSDCIQATDTALNTFNWLNPNAIVLVGGSHGGFLVCHLSGQFPDKFKAVSTRNPVTDVASMSIISDIPDWCYVEVGQEYTQKGEIDINTLIGMRNASPIVHAHKVKAPTLLLIGSKDLRVPHHQGTDFHLRLKANGVTTRMNLYDDEHPLGKVPNEMDAIINTLLWFDKHLKTNVH